MGKYPIEVPNAVGIWFGFENQQKSGAKSVAPPKP
jgi:hypothetical protein